MVTTRPPAVVSDFEWESYISLTLVADIAAELGMSPANIYKSFSSKEAIIQASADRNLVALTEAVHQRMAASCAALDRIEKVLLTIYSGISKPDAGWHGRCLHTKGC